MHDVEIFPSLLASSFVIAQCSSLRAYLTTSKSVEYAREKRSSTFGAFPSCIPGKISDHSTDSGIACETRFARAWFRANLAASSPLYPASLAALLA